MNLFLVKFTEQKKRRFCFIDYRLNYLIKDENVIPEHNEEYNFVFLKLQEEKYRYDQKYYSVLKVLISNKVGYIFTNYEGNIGNIYSLD